MSAYAAELEADKPTARFNLEPKTLKMKPKTGNPEQKPKTKKKFQSLAIRASKISVLFQNSNFHSDCVCCVLYVRSEKLTDRLHQCINNFLTQQIHTIKYWINFWK